MHWLCSAAITAFLGGLAIASSGCACTLVGCIDDTAIAVSFEEALSTNYTVSFTIGDRTGSVECTGVTDSDSANDIATMTGDTSGEVSCGTAGIKFVFFDDTLEDEPDVVAIEITSSAGDALANGEVSVEYDRTYPNGEFCDDGCAVITASALDTNP